MARLAKAGILLSIVWVVVLPARAAEGEALFQEKCASCHSIGGGRRVGPDLIGVQDRRSEPWLRSFVQSPQAMVAKDAEAKKLFDEYKVMMPGALLTDAQIPGVLGFIAMKGRGEGQAASVPLAYSASDVEGGRLMFEGRRTFSRGGPACISCHSVNAGFPVPGGTLAKDLTGAFSRLQGEGLWGMLKNIPFPAMQRAFPQGFTDEEIRMIGAFLKDTERAGSQGSVASAASFAAYGLVLFLVLVVVASVFWRGRRRQSVNQAIYDRQVRSQVSRHWGSN